MDIEMYTIEYQGCYLTLSAVDASSCFFLIHLLSDIAFCLEITWKCLNFLAAAHAPQHFNCFDSRTF